MTEPPVANLMSVAEAIAIIDAEPVATRVVEVPIAHSLGRRLAVDVFADRDHPPFDKAVMDGFAIESPAAIGDERIVVGTVHAGESAGGLTAGQAVAVMTGAPVPAGTVAVAPVEFTKRIGDRIRIDRVINAGQAVAPRGSDTRSGQLLLSSATTIGPAQIAVIASVGLATIQVFDRPRVAVMSTGDELIPIDQTAVGPQIRDSNSAMLIALLTTIGCDATGLGIVRDEPQVLRDKLDQCATEYDALFVTGGMSMGEKDFVPRLLLELGFDSKISKLRIKPGKPFVFATRGGQRVFGLPGNPVSAFVCTLRLAGRLLRRMAGGAAGNDLFPLTLTSPLPANGPREFYLPAVRSGTEVTPLNPNGSADIFTLARANVLVVRRENSPAATGCDHVECLSIAGV